MIPNGQRVVGVGFMRTGSSSNKHSNLPNSLFIVLSYTGHLPINNLSAPPIADSLQI